MRTRSAFTLIEVLLVLAILVAAAAWSMPALNATLKRQQLRNAADSLRATCADARIKAMRTGQIHMLRLEPHGRRYYVEPWLAGDDSLPTADAQPELAPPASEPTTTKPPRELPEGVTFLPPQAEFDSRALKVDETLTQMEQGASGGWSAPILFYGDGTSSQAKIIVAQGERLGIKLELKGFTGLCRIGEIQLVDTLLAEEQPTP